MADIRGRSHHLYSAAVTQCADGPGVSVRNILRPEPPVSARC